MKNLIRQAIFSFIIFWFSPLLIPFVLTTEKEIITADIKRWAEVLNLPEQGLWMQLLVLLYKTQEFRNLYYYRLLKGNLNGRISMYLLKKFYPECPSLFLDSSCCIGAGLFIQHGFSTIIMADIGEQCWVNQQVTIGYKDKSGRPKIGNNVRITAGAKVLGNIQVGDNVTIGANSVVVKDVPNDCVVVGIPAAIIRRNGVKVEEKL
ncbi:transferase hexapeptide repeat containing protein [Anabaenopsis circularis NIES-21]|uniref:Transferase hexapeptide repeat containing protein n=1 Tax=Anabaenopsis circularis NIES-21 TaxID=1085406 RepID=A0A1Z4GHQ3_9CYAN|nr:transferase hexapeptide repeat containing protein [Anabaenopsis circularis NIES-21]